LPNHSTARHPIHLRVSVVPHFSVPSPLSGLAAFRQRLVASDLRADRSSKGSVDVLRFVKHSISQMKTASVRELRQNFGSLMAWIEEGEEIQITMHRRVVARLVPEQPKSRAKVKMPDFAARLKRIHGGKVISAESAEAILDRNKGRY
jgi:antitoxin (DNA-binding transcriptional repressor) of toxin-antitoxin stability system